MKNVKMISSAVALAAALMLGGCSTEKKSATTMESMGQTFNGPVMAVDAPSPWADVKSAVAVIHPLSDSQVMGKVTFTQTDAGVAVVADVTGLTPGKHGFHIHQYGDCSDPKGASDALAAQCCAWFAWQQSGPEPALHDE